MTDRDISHIVKLIAWTVCFIVCSVAVVMLIGLFDPIVDNREIFKVIGPAFSTLVGSFATIIGALGTLLALKKGNGE